MRVQNILLSVIIVLLLGAGFYWYYRDQKNGPAATPTPTASTSSTATSQSASPTVAPTATGAAGMTISEPAAGALIHSPVSIKGTAVGSWFFEAQFPVELFDATGKLIGQGTARAQGDWMTDSPVPFELSITFAEPATTTGKILLKNDNPSGLSQNAKTYAIPVSFR